MVFSGKVYISDDCYIDVDRAEIKFNEIMVHSLTQNEIAALKLFVENEGRVLSRDTIIKTVWGYEKLDEKSDGNDKKYNDTDHLLTDLIKQIRKIDDEIDKIADRKIKKAVFSTALITKRGSGYLLDIKEYNHHNDNTESNKNSPTKSERTIKKHPTIHPKSMKLHNDRKDMDTYVERTRLLKKIKDKLEAKNNEKKICIISGFGGFGKTELARGFAYKHSSSNDTFTNLKYTQEIELVYSEAILQKKKRLKRILNKIKIYLPGYYQAQTPIVILKASPKVLITKLSL